MDNATCNETLPGSVQEELAEWDSFLAGCHKSFTKAQYSALVQAGEASIQALVLRYQPLTHICPTILQPTPTKGTIMSSHKFSFRSAHKMLKDLAAKEGKSIKLSSYNHHGCGVLTVVYDYDHGKGRRLHFATFSRAGVKTCILLGGERVEVPELQRMFQESFANLPVAV